MGVVGLCHHTLGHFIVQTQIQDGIHHTGHRSTCTRTYRNQQRILGVTKLAVHQSLSVSNSCIHFVLKQFYDFILTHLVIFITGVCSDGEAWRNRHANVIHFSKVCTFTAQQFTHLSISFSLSVAEGVNTFLTHNVF